MSTVSSVSNSSDTQPAECSNYLQCVPSAVLPNPLLPQVHIKFPISDLSESENEDLKQMEWIFGLPQTIKVIGKTFQLKVLGPEQDLEVDGWMKLDRQEIWVRLVDAKEQAQDTALHEVIHAVDETLSLGMKEKQVHALAAGLLGVFKDNPKFVEWILK